MCRRAPALGVALGGIDTRHRAVFKEGRRDLAMLLAAQNLHQFGRRLKGPRPMPQEIALDRPYPLSASRDLLANLRIFFGPSDDALKRGAPFRLGVADQKDVEA